MTRKSLDNDSAKELLKEVTGLDDEALDVAEGYALCSDGMKRHIRLVINEYIATHIPQLRELYDAASHRDQLRFNRIVEQVQTEFRKRGH